MNGPRQAAVAQPLQGYRIGVTAHRRAGDLVEALERRGAQVLHAPALQIAPSDSDEALLAETASVIAAAPDVVLATTAYGMRRWCEAADAAGRGEELLAVLARADIFVRGPKARGAVRAAGLEDAGISPDGTTAALTGMAIAAGVRGKVVAVRVHGHTDADALARLRTAGATVLTVTPYRWVEAGHGDRLAQLIDAVAARELDVLTFTSAPAADAVLSAAAASGKGAAFLAALRSGSDGAVASAAVGPVTAAPLLAAGITPLVPDRFRMGALVRLVCDHLQESGALRLDSSAGLLEVRGQALLIDRVPVSVAPAPLQLLKSLIRAGGAVRSPGDLAAGLGASEHSLHMAVSRLRAALPNPGLVETVVKRGYRLRV